MSSELLPTSTSSESTAHEVKPKRRRFSFRPFSIIPHTRNKHVADASTEHDMKKAAATALEHQRLANIPKSKKEKRAYNDALALRTLIVGSSSTQVTKELAKPKITQMKSLQGQLAKPNSANRVICHLRCLPAVDDIDTARSQQSAPIHAVCLDVTERDADLAHFAHLGAQEVVKPRSGGGADVGVASMGSPSIDALTEIFNDMHVVDLMKSPDFGLGQPAGGDGLLAGALPTPETVIQGFKQITPQLMALGFATGKAFTPNHSGIFPPTDRMSVLTYWWGLELCLPPPTLEYLSTAHSISGSAVNFLTALSMIHQGVREILPFVRYISQFLDFEFNAIKGQNRGAGVVCAATWIMPAALVPRPWDFPLPPDHPSTDPEKEASKAVLSEEAALAPLPSLATPISPPTKHLDEAVPPQAPTPVPSVGIVA